MEDADASASQIGTLFRACDLDGSGYIDEHELASICPDLTAEEVRDVFKELDADGDGQISIAEFSDGFKGISESVIHRTRARREQRLSSVSSGSSTDGTGLTDFLGSLNESFHSMSCQEQVCEMYQQLHHAELPQLVAIFESLIVSIIKDIRQHQAENERLEKSYKKEKESHSRHLRGLEEEMEVQVARVEQRVRVEERERGDAERDELRRQLETEVAELRANLSRLQKANTEALRLPADDTKARLDELTQENRHLRSALTDAQTNLALLRSEIATVRQQFDEKKDELECEKENVVEIIKEQESLTRQVHLLQNANKKLHDTNDDLRAAIEAARGSNKRTFLHRRKPVYLVLRRSRGSMENMQLYNAYMAPPPALNRSQSYHSGNSSLADELNMSLDGHVRKLLPTQDSCEMDNCSLPGDFDADSGLSTMSTLRDVQDIESECEANSLDDEYREYNSNSGQPHGRGSRGERDRNSTGESEVPEWAGDELDVAERIDSLNSNPALSVNLDLDELDEPDGMDLDEDQLAAATDELRLEQLDALGSPRARSLSPAARVSMSPPLPPRGRSLSPRPGSACSHCSECSQASSRSAGSSRQREIVTSASLQTQSRQNTVRRQLPQIPVPKPVTGEPERMYKVVLAGDAAVGKSSFIMRLCKNKFVPNLNSTLGVDFQTKVLEVDGRVIALQLWDTAGQERFRSIAKSYFRRADGVLLLYDSTYERSFLNVRDWIESIEDGAQKKIPIMLCGNKMDLRDEYLDEGKRCVKTEEGQRLAREFEGLFIETSAKEGSNILEAVTELARMLRTNEDLEVKTVGLKLQDMKTEEKKKLSTPCCN